ncbi:iron complex transport system permease protein [Quadrisphaera granulorum]|uniref:Iron complex transport system permease protein n=1 Tax=Quadrisphaera granulorum TaxID=317664 RepID=A0A315ZT36_9ACTN|nr:iron chelate uptake ABC transporter family permease subunit [Quadrisphaera granulorum]PWJ48459.1 iron complex transport system permease protein [Quadrisphaera granulorum]SZE98418.1 iron complex transport system permease protein [Quadrisphaera granulorum]
MVRTTTSRTTTAGRRVLPLLTALALLAATLAVASLLGGSYRASPDAVLRSLLGEGTPADDVVVLGLRLPRLCAALLVGAALATAGAVFQTLTRNPLGSPDVIGFTTGSATGALAVVVIGVGALSPAAGAWLGGALAAGVVLLLTRGAGTGSDRTVLVGIALAAALASVNDYLITRAPLEVAQVARTWLFGSLAVTRWPDVAVLAASLTVLLPAVFVQARTLRVLDLGDDVAAALGVPLGRSRVVLVLTAVGLTGTATAAAGPIGFVALAAPQLARRMLRAPTIPLVTSAVTGAVLLLAADLAAQRLLAPLQLPVGLVTGAIGGAYLLWLVVRAPGSR